MNGMWKAFHHPDISLPVVRRRIGLELIEMLDVLGDVAIHGAWSFLQNRSYPNPKALEQAVGRLSRQGLLVKRQGLHTPVLQLVDDAGPRSEDYFRPEKYWNRKWNGIWYLLMYDIPEKDRLYRNVLRQFLKRQRMGCFQKSVWIASHDIRAQYADLDEGAALGAFACLFEAKTVLGMSSEKVVWESWDFDGLYAVQKRFCDIYADNLQLLEEMVTPGMDDLMRLAAEEIDAYRSALMLDPLLPESLLPRDYKGRAVFELHRKIVHAIRTRLVEVNPT
ncbi:PaaX family transcriptional regulator C-terminal domain-containing protein [Pontiellaceae bacterium B12227]|nr:PaaX family transcriptional regulator C-terminal domain-containing protein [Pontiellaceae bacterium B12227]